MQRQLNQDVVEEWFKTTGGWVSARDLDTEREIITATGKSHRRVILHRLCELGVIEKHPSKLGVFRLTDNQAPIIDWPNADVGNTIDLKWPFRLEEWVTIYPKNLIALAGDPNAGKTAFCLNFTAKNQHRPEIADLLPIEYFTSEMGAEEMKVRLTKFPISDWSFIARERSSNFSQVINPNKINIIDYLEIADNFHLIAQEFMDIFNKLDRGICLIAIQKKVGSPIGRGAEFSLEKPRVYLSMSNNQLTIVKGKNWAVEGQNPNNRKWSFSLVQGWKFTKIEEI